MSEPKLDHKRIRRSRGLCAYGAKCVIGMHHPATVPGRKIPRPSQWRRLAGIALLALTTVRERIAALLFLLLFGLGVSGGMVLLTLVLSLPLRMVAGNSERWRAHHQSCQRAERRRGSMDRASSRARYRSLSFFGGSP